MNVKTKYHITRALAIFTFPYWFLTRTYPRGNLSKEEKWEIFRLVDSIEEFIYSGRRFKIQESFAELSIVIGDDIVMGMWVENKPYADMEFFIRRVRERSTHDMLQPDFSPNESMPPYWLASKIRRMVSKIKETGSEKDLNGNLKLNYSTKEKLRYNKETIDVMISEMKLEVL